MSPIRLRLHHFYLHMNIYNTINIFQNGYSTTTVCVCHLWRTRLHIERRRNTALRIMWFGSLGSTAYSYAVLRPYCRCLQKTPQVEIRDGTYYFEHRTPLIRFVYIHVKGVTGCNGSSISETIREPCVTCAATIILQSADRLCSIAKADRIKQRIYCILPLQSLPFQHAIHERFVHMLHQLYIIFTISVSNKSKISEYNMRGILKKVYCIFF